MKYNTNLLFYVFLIIIVIGCRSRVDINREHYKSTLPLDVKRAVRYYINKSKFKNKKRFITLSWVGFFEGEAIYVSSSRAYPRNLSEYPISWSYVDSSLVLLYDSRYSNYFLDSVSLKKEVNVELDKIGVDKHIDYLVEDNVPLRFIRRNNVQRVDTSELNVRLYQ